MGINRRITTHLQIPTSFKILLTYQGSVEMRMLSTNSSVGISPTPNSSSSFDIMGLSECNSSTIKTSTTNGTTVGTATVATELETNGSHILSSSLRTPPTDKRMETFCDTKECMKLTPVNLRCLISPIRQSSQEFQEQDCHTIGSAADHTLKENFGLISKQLEKVLQSLNVIFREIGYSNSEIISKEKLVFSTLSNSITKFFDEANIEMTYLTEQIGSDQEILNRILEIMHDSTGVDSIPDIYIRNAILMPKNKPFTTSPKKPLSLLSKKRLLQSAKEFVYNAYLPKIVSYLNGCIQLQLLYRAVNEPLKNSPSLTNVSKLPSLELAIKFKDQLQSARSNTEAISKFLRENKKDLFFGVYFNDISQEANESIAACIGAYDEEYNKRLRELTTTSQNISGLLAKLQIDINNDLDPQVADLLGTYSRVRVSTSSAMTERKDLNELLPVHRDINEKLRSVLTKYENILQERIENRDILLNKCRVLWSKLKVPETYTDNFISQNSGLSANTIRKYAYELEKLEQLKKTLIKTLINDSIQRIKELWSNLQYDHKERTSFLCRFDTMKASSTDLEGDERLLELCECETKDLERKMAIYEPVLKLLEQFKQLQADKLSLEESSRDSSRLLSRNSHKILLQEEKTRKKITRHFPRVIQELKSGLIKIEETFGSSLSFDGATLMESVVKQENELLSKYPRSRIHLGPSKASGMSIRKPKNKANLAEHRRQERNPSSTANFKCKDSSVEIHQTPARSSGIIERSGREISNSEKSNGSSASCINGFKFSSPAKTLTRLLPPTFIARKSGSKIPEPRVSNINTSISTTSSPVFRPRDLSLKRELVRPTRLFPVSSSKINQQRSNLPTLAKGATAAPKDCHNESIEKENMVGSTPKLTHAAQDCILSFSSPYREPNNSVYKLSMSPEGKCTLNIKDSEVNSGLDDTSFMDDENEKYYNNWKKEQILKLSGEADTMQ